MTARYNRDGDEILMEVISQEDDRQCDICRRSLHATQFVQVQNSDCQEAGCMPQMDLCFACIKQLAAAAVCPLCGGEGTIIEQVPGFPPLVDSCPRCSRQESAPGSDEAWGE